MENAARLFNRFLEAEARAARDSALPMFLLPLLLQTIAGLFRKLNRKVRA
jgi:hypothetical protein